MPLNKNMSFQKLQIPEALIALLESNGISKPYPIQSMVIPSVFDRKDVLGIAKTGSGKTAGYVLPILSRFKVKMGAKNRNAQTLVLVPTRELAEQVKGVFETYAQALQPSPKVMAVYGGVSINPQMKQLFGINILIATPGRLIELVESNAVSLGSVNTLVLDEADKMLNAGFEEELNKILSQLPKKRQNLLFSATLSKQIRNVQQILLDNPVVFNAEEDEETFNTNIEQHVYLVSDERKGPLLRYLLKNKYNSQILVFASSVDRADKVGNKLNKNGVECGIIHRKKSQGARNQALQNFKSNDVSVLVSTDLLARGIDIAFLPYVLNYELPRSPKDFIHRIGRTGRADNPGTAITLVTPEELSHFKVILKKMNAHVDLIKTDDLDLKGY